MNQAAQRRVQENAIFQHKIKKCHRHKLSFILTSPNVCWKFPPSDLLTSNWKKHLKLESQSSPLTVTSLPIPVSLYYWEEKPCSPLGPLLLPYLSGVNHSWGYDPTYFPYTKCSKEVVHISAHISLWMYVWMNVYMYICMYVCMYVLSQKNLKKQYWIRVPLGETCTFSLVIAFSSSIPSALSFRSSFTKVGWIV